jgi:8-oxo-dGTP pyrophosphatase MutT (NUDIX family)
MTSREVRYQAAIIDAGHVLLLYCVPHGEQGFWLLPGGGREPGESAEECVAREVREEAGVDVDVGPMLYEVEADPPDGTYARWRTYRCTVTRGVPTPGGGEGWAELTAVRWLSLEDPSAWEAALDGDPFLLPQLERIRASISSTDALPAHRVGERARKVVPVVQRGRDEAVEVLVFRHPLAGIRLVKGSVEPGESTTAAAVRELAEEAGISSRVDAPLGAWCPAHAHQEWLFLLMRTPHALPDRWSHDAPDDGGHRFEFFWHRLDAPASSEWHSVFQEALEQLRQLLPIRSRP